MLITLFFHAAGIDINMSDYLHVLFLACCFSRANNIIVHVAAVHIKMSDCLHVLLLARCFSRANNIIVMLQLFTLTCLIVCMYYFSTLFLSC